jgi:hypothetical protein
MLEPLATDGSSTICFILGFCKSRGVDFSMFSPIGRSIRSRSIAAKSSSSWEPLPRRLFNRDIEAKYANYTKKFIQTGQQFRSNYAFSLACATMHTFVVPRSITQLCTFNDKSALPSRQNQAFFGHHKSHPPTNQSGRRMLISKPLRLCFCPFTGTFIVTHAHRAWFSLSRIFRCEEVRWCWGFRE